MRGGAKKNGEKRRKREPAHCAFAEFSKSRRLHMAPDVFGADGFCLRSVMVVTRAVRICSSIAMFRFAPSFAALSVLQPATPKSNLLSAFFSRRGRYTHDKLIRVLCDSDTTTSSLYELAVRCPTIFMLILRRKVSVTIVGWTTATLHW